MKVETRERIIFIILAGVIFAACSGGLTTLAHMICSRYILHIHGKPEFLSNSLIVFSMCEKLLLAAGYVLLGHRIPIKNSILKGVTYMGIIWASNFLPQFMGMAFADGPIAEQVFVISDLTCDSIVYMASGVVLGLLFSSIKWTSIDYDKVHIRWKAVILSAVILPIMIILGDQLLGLFNSSLTSLNAMKVSEKVKLSFYINFYSWFVLSGGVISIFYQLTSSNWFKFAMIYGFLIWSPVVLIMILFGTEIAATIVYDVLFIICITLICYLNKKLNR